MNAKGFALLFGAIVFSGMIVQAQQLQLTTQESVAPSFSGLRSTESSGFRQVKFSGSLTNQLGQPLTGVTGITFAIYKDREGGAPLWIESQNVQLNSQGNY